MHTKPTFHAVKNSILNDIKKLLKKNYKTLKINNFKIDKKTSMETSCFDELVFETIYYKYIPIAYDDFIEWTKQEPVLVNTFILPCKYSDSSSILQLLQDNIVNYLKRYVYDNLNWIIDNVKKG